MENLEDYILKENLFLTALPLPLSKEEQNELFLKYLKSNDEDIRATIITHNIRLVINIVNKNIKSTDKIDKRELVEVGIIGLIKAFDSFNIDKKREFSTYASRCITNEILMFIRSLKKKEKDISIYTNISANEGKNWSYEDILVDENQNLVSDYENKESLEEIMEVIDTLSNLEKDIILLKFGFNKDNIVLTNNEIGKIYGISGSYVSRIKTKAIKKIKERLKK